MAETAPGRGWVRVRRTILAALLLGLAVPPVLHVNKESDYRGFVAFGEVALSGEIPHDPAVEARQLSYHWATWAPGFVPLASALAVLDGLARVPTRPALQLVAGVLVAAFAVPALIVGPAELGAWHAGWRAATARSLDIYLQVGDNQSALATLTRVLEPGGATAASWALAGTLAAAAVLALVLTGIAMLELWRTRSGPAAGPLAS